MKVIITGATGFIGRNLAEDLHAAGVEVVATGRSREVGEALRRQGIAFEPADLLSPRELERAFTPADCVVHCAGKAGDWGQAREFDDVNVQGTRNVRRACELAGINRVVFISTPSVYFSGRDRLDVAEADPLPPRPLTHYARTKLIAERALLALTTQGLDVIILRPRAVYGPHDATIAPRVLRLAQKRRFPLIGGGEALTDTTYVENLNQAVRACLEAPEAAWNRIYNISNGEPMRIRDWFAALLDVFGRPFRPVSVPAPVAGLTAAVMEAAARLPFGPDKPSFTRFSVGYMSRSMTLSIDQARRHLGYEPRLSNQQGFARYARWYSSGRAPGDTRPADGAA